MNKLIIESTFILLLLIPTSFLYGEQPLPKKVDPVVQEMVVELLKQEGIEEIEIYEAGAEFPSFAAISFTFSGHGMRLHLLINQATFNKLTLQEQQSVILHEIGHIKRGAYCGLLCAFAPYLAGAIAAATAIITQRSSSAPLLWRLSVAGGAGYLATLLSQIVFAGWARHEEFEADAYAFNVHHNANVMQSLLEKRKEIFDKNGFDDASWWSGLFADHPSSQERSANIQLLAAARF